MPIIMLVTVREETLLYGAHELDPKGLGGAVMGFNVDSTRAVKLPIGVVGQENWDVEIQGKAAYAGVAPERGIFAMLVASVVLTEGLRGA